jgi:acyl carrier protein
MDSHKEIIREFISGYIDNGSLTDDDDLFRTGYVNSLFAMELVAFVENRFRITIENEELNIDNFRSINALASLVSNKTQDAGK